jgi:hypothetical protein
MIEELIPAIGIENVYILNNINITILESMTVK